MQREACPAGQEIDMPEDGDLVCHQGNIAPLRITALLGKPYRFGSLTAGGRTLMPTEWVDFGPKNRLDLDSFLNYFKWVKENNRWESTPKVEVPE